MGMAGAEWIERRWRLFRHFAIVPKRTIALLVLALMAGALSTPAMSLTTGLLVDRTVDVVHGAATRRVLVPLILIGAILTYQLLSALLIAPVRARTRQLVDGAINSRIRKAVGALPGVEHVESQEYRQLAGLTTTGYDSIGTSLEAQLQLIMRYSGAIFSGLIIASVSPLVAVVTLVIVLAKRFYLRRLYAPALANSVAAVMPQVLRSRYWITTATTSGGFKDTRVFGFGEYATKIYKDDSAIFMHALSDPFRAAAVRAWPAWIAEFVAFALPFSVLAHSALDGHISVGRLAAGLTAVVGLRDIGGVGNETYQIESTLSSAVALDDLEERSRNLSWKGRSQLERAEPPTIRFEGVDFSYPKGARPVFTNLNLTLNPGESVALVGENGIGKSTLVKLLARFYEPTNGRITADGVDIGQMAAEDWRARLSIVTQNFVKLPLTVRQNIALAQWDHPDVDELVAGAVEAAGAGSIIDGLSHGLDTVLSRRYRNGADLSGGQWQRIVLARAFYAASLGSNVLILDEPTAHLDVHAEIELFDRLLTHAEGATAVVVSHRYSTVRRAQRIVVLGETGVVEDGSHESLMAAGGVYAGLFTLQAEAFTGAFE